jgi:hypothetical protein
MFLASSEFACRISFFALVLMCCLSSSLGVPIPGHAKQSTRIISNRPVLCPFRLLASTLTHEEWHKVESSLHITKFASP